MSDEDQASPEPEDLPEDSSDPAEPYDGLSPRERREQRLQRKRARRIQTRLFVAAIVVLVLFMVAIWPVMARRLDAVHQLDLAQSLLLQAKPTVDDVDKVVVVQLSPQASAGVSETAPQILVARRELKQGLVLIDGAMPHITDDEQKRGSTMKTAIGARLDMIDRAPAILATSVKAVKAKELVDQAWKLSQSANAAEISATANYKSGKATSVASASVTLQRVKGQFGDARALYSQAASAFPGAGLEGYVAYSELRSQGAKQLLSATTKWLKGDPSGAAVDFGAYGRTVAKASAAAKKLSEPPSAPGKAFRKVAGPATDAYLKAKKQALEAEQALVGL